MGEYLSDGNIIFKSCSILFFRLWVINVFLNLNQPIAQLYFSIDQDDILWMNLSMNDVILVEIFHAFQEGWECIGEFIFGEKLLVERPFTILQFYLHVWVSLWVEQSVSVKERSQKIWVTELLQKGFWLFYFKIVKSLLRMSVNQQNVPRLKFSQNILFRCCFLEISHLDLFSLIYFLLILIKVNQNL